MRVFVTGATGGIGRELVRGLVIAGAEIIVGCRDVARAAGFGPRVRAYALDLASLASVRDAVRRADTELPALDALVNAAGVWPRQRRTTSDGLELAFGTNHVAHHALTIGLLPVLRRARMPRVITVASGLHVRGKLAWDDLQQARGGFNGVRAYEQSKLANVMFALALARRMGDALASNAIHPGIVRTNLTREYPEMLRDVAPRAIVPAAVAARAIQRLVVDPRFASTTGRYYDRDRELAPSKVAQSVADQDRLWAVTEALAAPERS